MNAASQMTFQSRATMYNGYMGGAWVNLAGHVAEAQEEVHRCYKCNFVATATTLTQHIKTVHGDEGKQYKCEFCDYSSTKKENLSRHKNLRGHVVEAQAEVQKCHKCDFRANVPMLKQHIKLVHGVEMKQHKCDHCEYSSTRKENLTRHKKQHLVKSAPGHAVNMKFFKCDLCDYSSARKDNLARHKKLRGHVSEAHENDYKCPWCNFRSNTIALKQHINSVHSGKMKQYKCDQCYYSSSRKDNLTRHKNLRGHAVKGLQAVLGPS